MFYRYHTSQILHDLEKGRNIVIYGPRQVGKTTIAKKVIEGKKSKYYNCDIESDRDFFSTTDTDKLGLLVRDFDCIVIDEAQRVRDIGLTLKVLIDTYPDKRFIITGSSSLELSQGISEPLTGRVFTYIVYPIGVCEQSRNQIDGTVLEQSDMKLFKSVEQLLVYGSYPAVLREDVPQEKERVIQELTEQYLFKDTLSLYNLKRPDILKKLLELLAFQVGSEVSISKLAGELQVDDKTVLYYIDICEKLFIIFSLRPYTKSKRAAITKKNKYYFFDLGIRNSLIRNLNSVQYREDIGKLWENFCVVERIKRNALKQYAPLSYFYRTYHGGEVDLIEEYNQTIQAFEFKFAEKSPNATKGLYDDLELKKEELAVVHKLNFSDFLVR